MQDLDDLVESATSNGNLDLSHHGLEAFDTSIFELGENLVNINLSFNQIILIPVHINKLILLQELHLQSNKIEELPKEISFLKRLKVLDLSSNSLLRIDSAIEGCVLLRVLNLNDNNLEELPVELSNLKLLKELKVTNNKLTTIFSDLCYCISLQIVDFSGNEDISNIPLEFLSNTKFILYICGLRKTLENKIEHLTDKLDAYEDDLQRVQSECSFFRCEVEVFKKQIIAQDKKFPRNFLKLKSKLTKLKKVSSNN